MANNGANLKHQFSRLAWAQSQYYPGPTSAIRSLNVPLKIGSLDPYFTDDIGNVSTSRFRSNVREANLELKPRYPVFGGWKYSFRIGWDANLTDALRKLKPGDGYVLKVPFLEGPKMGEGVSYEKVEVRVILPEGARNVKFETKVPLVAQETSSYKTFMDTLGRTTLKLTAMNVVDASRDQDLIVGLALAPFYSLVYHSLHAIRPCTFSYIRFSALSPCHSSQFLACYSPSTGDIRLSFQRRLPQTHHCLPRRPRRLRCSLDNWQGGYQHWEVRCCKGRKGLRRELEPLCRRDVSTLYNLSGTGPSTNYKDNVQVGFNIGLLCTRNCCHKQQCNYSAAKTSCSPALFISHLFCSYPYLQLFSSEK